MRIHGRVGADDADHSPGSQSGGASSKPSKRKPGETVQPTSVHAPSDSADCQSPTGTTSWGRWPAEMSAPEDVLYRRYQPGARRDGQRKWVTGVVVPDLRSIDAVPMRALAGAQEVVDGGARRPVPCFGLGAPGLDVVATLGMWSHPQLGDDRVRVRHGASVAPSALDTACTVGRPMTTPPSNGHTASQVQRVYLLLTLLTTLAASFIWGVNTLFLLDAGLSNTEAFAANAFFSVGMVIFEVPTGVVADTRGRRFSFMLGAATLLLSTLLYLVMWQVEAPFIGWALASILLGLGFTFFSGATEAWLVDALGATGFEGNLETVFGRGQTIAGVAMLSGSVLGGVVAQLTNLGVPYVLRAIMLGVALLAAFWFMRDLGFKAKTDVSTRDAVERHRARLHRRWPAQPPGALDDAGRTLHRWRRFLRLLRHAAIPAGALR